MRLTLIAAVLALSGLANPYAAAASQDAKRVIITFKSGTPQAQRHAALRDLKARTLKEIVSNDPRQEFSAVVADVELPQPVAPGNNMALGVSDLAAANPDIMTVEEDFRIKWIESTASFQATPLPGGSAESLGLKFSRGATGAVSAANLVAAATRGEIPWGVTRVKAPAAWDYTEGAGVRVAIIDTGINAKHRDLAGKVDGGYSAVSDCDKEECWTDDNGHGTHVAGTIGAKRDGRGVVGVAPRARLYAVKVLDADGSGSLSDVVEGIVWAANNEMQVANMSLGSSMPSDAMHRAIRYAKARGVVVVAAAGNSGGSVGYPASYPETIAVSASDWNDKIAGFSSRGEAVDFIAPGVAVVSTAYNGDYANFSGTSMAAPHVAGLAALAVAQGYRGLDGPDGVFGQLQKAARPISGLSATDQGAGMIDAGLLTRNAEPLFAAAQ